MTIKRSILLTTLPILMLGGCLKEDYKDPEAFAKKYIRADLERRFPRELWDELQYDDVELVNVTSKMKEAYSGARNEISCQVRLVPERGVKHYRRVDLRCDFAWGLGSLSPVAERFLPKARCQTLDKMVQDMHKKKPLLVLPVNLGEPEKGDAVISCFRTTDENGVFVPLDVGGKSFSYSGVDVFFDTDYFFGEKSLKTRGGLEACSPEGRAAYVTFSNRCLAVKAAIKRVNGLAEEIQNVTNIVRWKMPSFVKARRAELVREQVTPLEAERASIKESYSRRVQARERKLRDLKNRDRDLANEKDRLAASQARLARIRSRMEADLERQKEEAANPHRSRRPPGARIIYSGQPRNLEELQKKQDAGNARLKEIAAQQDAIRVECEKITAEANTDKTDTIAKVGALKSRIEAQMAKVDNQVSTDAESRLKELKSRIEDLTREFNARVDELEKMM